MAQAAGLNAAPPAPDPQEAAVQKSAMSKLAEGLGGPSAGLQGAIGQGRNAVAQFAKDTQRQAAATAVKQGAVGQGTQTALGQEVRGSVMSKLAANEANNAKMISDEGKAFMDKALDIGQQNKQLAQGQQQIDNQASQFQQGHTLEQKKVDQNQAQFDVTSGQTQQQINNQASQFGVTAGQNQQQINNQAAQFQQNLALQKDELSARVGAQNMEMMAKLGGDIPVIGAKLMDNILGKSGNPLSPEEKAELGKWHAEQKAKGEKTDAQMDKLIDSMVQEATNPKKSAMTQLAEKEAENQLGAQAIQSKMASGAQLTPDEVQAGIKTGAFPQFNASSIPMGKHANAFLQKNPNAVVNVEGKAYKIVKGSAPRTGAGTFSNQERHTDIVEVVDMQDGKTKYFWGGKLQDKAPKTVSNDISPFGF